MKLIRQFLLYVGFFVVFWLKSNVLYAYIPPEIQLNAVFNFLEEPVSGNQQVTVRLISGGEEKYKEIVDDVFFDHGVAQIVIGGEGTDLINSIFDDPNIQVKISVLKHQLSFPMNSVPYSIRSKESNKARRVDNENIMKFLETERRIGVNMMNPEVALDINGVFRVQDKLNSDEISNGVLYWDGVENSFYVYKDSKWVSLSWYPDLQDQSKWTRFPDEQSIGTLKKVGIGRSPNSYSLAVSNNVFIKDALQMNGDVVASGGLRLINGHGFSTTGGLTASSVTLNVQNHWRNGDLSFSGVLQGDGGSLTNLHDFPDDTFDSTHLGLGIIATANIDVDSISAHHLSAGIVSPNHLILDSFTAAMIDNQSVSSNHIVDGSIQMHHMKRAQISSDDIKLNEFVKEKFANDSIESHHISNQSVSSLKVANNQLLANHFNPDSLSNEKILNGELTGSHVPLNSIPLVNYNDTFSISRGGTGKVVFDSQGVIYTRSSEYQTDSSNLSITNGRMGIKTSPKNTHMVSIGTSIDSIFAVEANHNNDATLRLENSVATWNFIVDSMGDLNIKNPTDLVLKIKQNGMVGFGMSPSVALSLNGPLHLAATMALPANGVIRYQSNQFQAYNNGWTNLTSNMLSLRYFPEEVLDHVTRSTVLHAHDSDIKGDSNYVYSANQSTVHGQGLTVAELEGAMVSGARSDVGFVHNGTLLVDHSHLDFMQTSSGKFIDTGASQMSDSTIVSNASQLFGIQSSRIDAQRSDLAHVTHSDIHANGSRVSQVKRISGLVNDSVAYQLNDSAVDIENSLVSDVKNASLNLRSSTALQLDNVQATLTHSDIRSITDAVVDGEHVTMLGGHGHSIKANHYIGLSGNRHHVQADRGIGIGDNLSIQHDDVTLINLSDSPLVSDHSGQLKIHANGGVDIRMGESFSLQVGADGWSNISDKTLKNIQQPIDPIHILNKVRELPVHYWAYKNQEDTLHLGPFSQDFYQLFKYGNSDKVIHSIDADGVLLAAIKGIYLSLNQLVDTYQINHQFSGDQSMKASKLKDQLLSYSEDIDELVKSYDYQQRLITQFQSDYDSQEQMIDFIDRAIQSLNFQILMMSVYDFRWLIFAAALLLGVFIRFVIVWRARV